MIVVADSGPLRYLVLIDQAHLLGVIFERVYVPAAVRKELTHSKTPEAVARWMAHAPDWLETPVGWPAPRSSGLDHLDEGERDAIALAEQLSIPMLLIDETEGRNAAESRGLKVLGTIGILERAAILHLVDFPRAFRDLERTNFHMSAAFRKMLIERHKLK
jgi:predicted nucleic acid-binding protein